MPTGCEYSRKEKQFIFNLISFVEGGENGWRFSLYNVKERFNTMLGISMRSVERFKGKFREDQECLVEEIKKRK